MSLLEPMGLDVAKRKGFQAIKAPSAREITVKIDEFVRAYEPTHIIGDVAKRKGFQAIKAPSAQDVKAGGENIVSFAGFK